MRTDSGIWRKQVIEEYHDLLKADEALSADIFAAMRSAMRANRLVYGDRPIGVALRPHLLDERQFARLTRNTQLVASAIEKLAQAAVQSPDLMQTLGMTKMEARLALVDPGFAVAGISTRMDSFVHDDTIKFVEYNAENPSSLSDQEGLNRILCELPAMRSFAERYQLRQFSPSEQLLETLLETYRKWQFGSGGKRAPNIAILDWNNPPTWNEFVLLRECFTGHGIHTTICSPDELEYHDDSLYCEGTRIDLVYKRVLIHEFLTRYDETHPLIQAYLNSHVCLVNPFRCKLMHKKASFEILTDEAYESWFDKEETEAIRECVPWTRRVADRRTTREGKSIDLLRFVSQNRSSLILKPNDDYGGRGVLIGSHLDEKEWADAIQTALAGDYIVQDRVELKPEEFPLFSDDTWSLEPMYVDTNPFLFKGKVCGAMVRLSVNPIVNVTSGGGETGFFVIESQTH
jgi:glutathionylspermidine synthase